MNAINQEERIEGQHLKMFIFMGPKLNGMGTDVNNHRRRVKGTNRVGGNNG